MVPRVKGNLALSEASCKALTAFQLHDACLDVHGEILQVHGAGQCQGDSEERKEFGDAASADQGSCASSLAITGN